MYATIRLMYIPRYLDIAKELKPGKTLVLFGPRRVGKTTLVTEFMQRTNKQMVFYRGDEMSTQHAFEIPDSTVLNESVGKAEVVILDEAQAIPNIGKSLKIINDTMPGVAIVVTGSSSFELAGQVGEPLTGRKTTKYLFPIALCELLRDDSVPKQTLQKKLQTWLVFGMYPDVLTAKTREERTEFLQEIVNSYLLKDILTYQEVKGSRVLLQLLILLAHQIGSEVSLTEIGIKLGIDKNTVSRYLDLMEKAYILFRLGGFSRNLRSEITRTAKYYFYDIGIRNAVINNFNVLSVRDDVGKLWENFVIVERLKKRLYHNVYANQYFWRTWQQNEIDLVEEREGKLFGYEIKWKQKQTSIPQEWREAYGQEASWEVITQDNLLAFVL